MKGSKEMLTNPFHWHNTKCPFISYLQLFTQEGPTEPKEAHGASCDAWLHAPGARARRGAQPLDTNLYEWNWCCSGNAAQWKCLFRVCWYI